LNQINAENAVDSGWLDKSLTAAAKNRLLQHTWPGNVRELLNTIRRATIWTREVKIDVADIQQAILPNLKGREDDILDRPIENGVELPTLIGEVARHYIVRTLKATGGNKTKAAELLGLNNYQTLTNWIQKHEIELDS
jgi:DNA-binding NtrC family response regulator